MILRFYPKKDATIYEKFPKRNTGIDAVLDISKVVEGTGSYNSRVLIDFDYTTISASIVDMGLNPNNFRWNLKLYGTEEQEVPLEYTLYCYPISQSWSMGTGRYGNLPQTTEGVSWYYRNGELSPTTAWATASFGTLSTASFQITPGGGNWYTSSFATQSFSYKAADIDMDVTSIMHQVQSGSIAFNGFILKKDQTDETSLLTFKSIKFFSKDTNTVYSPILEAKYDDSVYNSSLSAVNQENEYNIVAVNLQPDYKESTTPKIRFSARPRYPSVTFSTSSAYLDRYRLPQGTQYAIYSAHTDDAIVGFSNYTKVSADTSGNYFNLSLESFQPERFYKVLLKVPNSGSFGSTIFDNNWVFKVSRNQ
jgi:hypothetical protein